jgi:hypothetical protein
LTVGLLGLALYIPVFSGFILSMMKIQRHLSKNRLEVDDMIFVSLAFSVAITPVFILGGGGVYNIVVLVFSAALANLAAMANTSPIAK